MDLISVYENLLKLYEAAWVIHQCVSDRPYLALQKEKDHSHNLTSKIVVPKLEIEPRADVTLYSLNTDSGYRQRDCLVGKLRIT